MNTLDDLIEKNHIEARLIDLFLATDLRDWPRLEQCFADKVQFNMSSVGGPNAEVTPHDISETWDTGLKPLKAIHHQIGNLVVTLADNKATASCYGIAYHYLPTKSGNDTRVFVGEYDFGLQKQSDDWKVSAMTFTVKFIDGNKELEKDAAA